MGKFKKLQEDIENVTNKEVVKQTRISGVATIVLIISVACAIGGMSFEDPNSSMPTFLFTASFPYNPVDCHFHAHRNTWSSFSVYFWSV